ncbi:response regulator [Candidatus Daviesbacteria bacterium]|nr:response regulator [Candidatus Daviesbacteria bacterium]
MKRILIVDDDQYIRDVYREVLEGEKYLVETAIDGQEGLIKAQEGGFDLILLDAMMPKVDGLGVLRGLKENPPKQENKVILLLTNLAHDKVIDEAMQNGAKSYLIKSEMNPDEFLQNIKKFLEPPVESQG